VTIKVCDGGGGGRGWGLEVGVKTVALEEAGMWRDTGGGL